LLSFNEYHRPKTGNTANEYEDAFDCDSSRGVFAIADGATESSFSDIWAGALVSTFVDNPPGFDRNDRDVMKDILRVARARWYGNIDWASLSWFQKNKALLGSYSTLLGLQIEVDGTQNRFRCMTIGDSCMFHISGGRMESFPFSDSRDLSNTPRLMWSGHGYNSGLEKEVEIPGIEVKYGKLRAGDTVVLATDAISKWILTHKAEKPWIEITSHSDDFYSFVGNLISGGEIKNDDVTVIFITVS
jgi:hypothetical protein